MPARMLQIVHLYLFGLNPVGRAFMPAQIPHICNTLENK